MRRDPLRIELHAPIDYITAERRMRELQVPHRSIVSDYELPIWWTALGILVTGIVLILCGGV